VAFKYWRVATVLNDGWLNNLNSWDQHYRIVNELWYFEKTLIPTGHEYISWFLHTCLQVCGSCTSCLRFQIEKIMSQLLPHKLKRQFVRFTYMLTETLNWSDSTISFSLIFHALMFNFLEKKIGSKFVEVAEMCRLDQSSLSKVSRLQQVLCNIIYICMYMRSGQLRFTLSCNLHKPKLHNVWYIITRELNLYRSLVSPNRQPRKS
jgi:hypothetical protein